VLTNKQSLCQLSRAFGLKVVLTCPEKVAPSKKQQLRALGAELIVCPDCKPSDERHFTNVAARLAVERNALFLNQFENPSNSRAHHLTTGPEIIASLGKDVLLACCTGTGGTAAGIGQALFEANGGKRALCVMAIRGQPLTYE
jgi:cystathionine beta-synthase